MLSRNALGLAALTLAGSMGTWAQAAIVIDSFSAIDTDFTPWPVMQTTVGSVNVHETGVAGVLGGVRDTTTTLESVTIAGVDFMRTAIVPGAGVILDYAASAGADGELALLYNGDGSLHADFSSELSIDMSFTEFDFAFGAPLPVTITLSDGTNSATLSKSLNASGPGNLSFAINDFSGIGGVDLTDVTSVTVALDPGVAADYRLTAITTTTIPSPGALALLAMSGIAGRPRRRR